MVYAEPETLREMEAKSKEYLESRNNFILITLSRNTCTMYTKKKDYRRGRERRAGDELTGVNWVPIDPATPHTKKIHISWFHDQLIMKCSLLFFKLARGHHISTRDMIVIMEHRKWWLEKTYSSFGSIIGKGDILLEAKYFACMLRHTEGWLLEDMQLYSTLQLPPSFKTSVTKP